MSQGILAEGQELIEQLLLDGLEKLVILLGRYPPKSLAKSLLLGPTRLFNEIVAAPGGAGEPPLPCPVPKCLTVVVSVYGCDVP